MKIVIRFTSAVSELRTKVEKSQTSERNVVYQFTIPTFVPSETSY